MKKIILLLLTLFSLCLTGCGKDKQLEQYKEDITNFNINISDIATRMDDIDPNSEDAIVDMLNCLSEMQYQFSLLAEMEVPSAFASIDTLADEAADYMTEATSLYGEVFSSTEYPEEKATAALENYNRAMTRLSYISSLLQGELPEGDNIIITEEENLDFEPVTGD